MQMPDPDAGIIGRKAEIVARLHALPAGAVVVSEPAELRA
jgi:hypothetical protein